MTLEEYNKEFNTLLQGLESEAYGNIMVQCASVAIAEIRDRVLEKGITSTGGKYRDYTEAYKQLKIKEGKYKGFVNFSFTNRMWGNIKLVSPREELNSGVAVIKATTPEDQEKLNKNTDSRGDILVLNENERLLIAKTFNEGMKQIIARTAL